MKEWVQKLVRTRVFIAILAFGIGHWMGFWYGRFHGLYDASKAVGIIPETETFIEWMETPTAGSNKTTKRVPP